MIFAALSSCQPGAGYPCSLPSDGRQRWWGSLEPRDAPYYSFEAADGQRLETSMEMSIVSCDGEDELNLWWDDVGNSESTFGTIPFYAGPGLLLFPDDTEFIDPGVDYSMSFIVDDANLNPLSLPACNVTQFQITAGTWQEQGFSISARGSAVDLEIDGVCQSVEPSFDMTFSGSKGHGEPTYAIQ